MRRLTVPAFCCACARGAEAKLDGSEHAPTEAAAAAQTARASTRRGIFLMRFLFTYLIIYIAHDAKPHALQRFTSIYFQLTE
jgi:hypothetical protein